MQYDIFISHASEDKAEVADPLANCLKEHGLKVWLDKFEITVGDSIHRSIEKGLSSSRFGIVILSPHFFQKEWPQRELDALFAKNSDDLKVILPIWHNISQQQVAQYSPLLADKLAATTNKGIEAVAQEILRAIQLTLVQKTNKETSSSVEHLSNESKEFGSFRRNAISKTMTGGALPPDCITYVDRNTDEELWSALQKPHGFATVWGPRQFGKTSALIRLAAKATAEGRKIVFIELATYGNSDRDNFAQLLYYIALDISHKLEIKKPNPELFLSPNFSAETSFQAFVQNISSPTLILFDETDSLASDQLTALFRIIESITKSQLRGTQGSIFIAAALATFNLRVRYAVRPFLKIGYHTNLSFFTERETQRLFELADIMITDKELAKVYQWTGGHPYFVQLSARQLEKQEPLEDLFNPLTIESGSNPLYHYVSSYAEHVDPQGYQALHKIVLGIRPPEEPAQKLLYQGFIKLDRAGYRFANLLSETYFTRRLENIYPKRKWWQFWKF